MSDTSDPAAIEDQLAQTRARLGSHLDELSRRLSPGQLLDEGLGYLREGQGAVFARNLGAQVRDNPLPVMLAGVGIAWLAAATSLRGAPASRSRALVPYEGDGGSYAREPDGLFVRAQRAGDAVARTAGETEAAFRERVADAQAGVLGVMRQAQETAAAFADRVQQAFDAARRNTHDAMGSMGDAAQRWRERGASQARAGAGVFTDTVARGRDYANQAGDYASQAADYAVRARDGMARGGESLIGAVADNPVVLGAIGLAAGALLGALLPRTAVEDAYLGETAGKVAAGARDMAGEVVERGARVANAAMDAGYEAARDEGESFTASHRGDVPEGEASAGDDMKAGGEETPAAGEARAAPLNPRAGGIQAGQTGGPAGS